MGQKVIHVAIGLIFNRGKILVGWREEHLHQGGCYEFPGGKVEDNENSQDAVIREIKEEVGIDVTVVKLFHELEFHYPDRDVHLFFYQCLPISQQNIDVPWQWVAMDQVIDLAFPAANMPILQRLNWSRYLAITPSHLQQYQFKAEIDLCYLRLAQVNSQVLHHLQQSTENMRWIVRVEDYWNLEETLQQQIFAIHLNSRQLYDFKDLKQFKSHNVIAACHTEMDIQQANLLGCDAIFLSPVHATATHPDQLGIGWTTFAKLLQHANMPVYALGGVNILDKDCAIQHGAYGIAGISDFWLEANSE